MSAPRSTNQTLTSEQPSVAEIRANMHGAIPEAEHAKSADSRGHRRQSRRGRDTALSAKGRKDNAPPAMLRRGQNR